MLHVRPPAHPLPLGLVQLVVEETLRGAIPPEDPEILRFLGGLGWRMEQRLTPVRARIMAEEVRRSFGCSARAADAIVREAQDLSLQGRLENLVVPKMSRADLDRIVRVELPPFEVPAILLFPHSGNTLLLVAALAARLPGLVVFGARPGEAGDWAHRQLLRRRRADQDRLPIRWETDPGALPGWLARGHCVAAGFDDRAWTSWERTPLLGRTALLSPDPFSLGAPVHFAQIARERDKSSRVIVQPDAPRSLSAFVRERAEPAVRALPGHYASWLADRRISAATDDPPFFIDYAPDDRWRRWAVAS